jgi:anti-anti-sigma factor
MFTTEPSESLKAMLAAAMLTETAPIIDVTDFEPERWEFTTDLTGAVPVVTAAGFLDILNKEAMRQELLSAAAYGPIVVLDMADIFCDASGMGVLDEVARLLADHGAELRLVTTRKLTIHFLNAFRLNRQMRVFPTLLEALSGTWQNRGPQPEVLAA